MASPLAIRARLAARGLDFDLTLPASRTTAIVGPNGAGKSSLFDLIAGHLVPDRGGVIALGDEVISGPGTHLPAHRRPIGLLAQQALLFPHLSVGDNVAFGPRSRGVGRAEARARAADELAAVGASDLTARRPGTLSGGQAQRVALARALAADPDVLLLDEPLTGVDATQAPGLRELMARRRREADLTAVLITHDLQDLWTLADELVVLEGGRVAAQGPLEELLTRPTTGFLAELCGLNLLAGRVVGPDVLDVGGPLLVGVPAGVLTEGGHALATFDPAAIIISPGIQGGSARNQWPATVTSAQPRGPLVRVGLALAGGGRINADVTARSAAELGLAPGLAVTAIVKAAQVSLVERG